MPDRQHRLMFLYHMSQDYCRSDIELGAIAMGDRRGRWRGIFHFLDRFHAAKSRFTGNASFPSKKPSTKT